MTYAPTQDVSDFAIRSVMPEEDVFALDQAKVGFLDATIQSARISEIYARLKKRYDIEQIEADEPEIIKQWIAKLVTPAAYMARGVNPDDQALTNVIAWRKDAQDQLKETADSENGLYDLPLLADGTGGSGVSAGGPLVSATASPYVPFDIQRAEGRYDDSQRFRAGVTYGNAFRRFGR